LGKSRQQTVQEETNERMNKPVIETQRVTNPARERLAATRKRTLRSVPARGARSVWSECLSRVIESRKTFSRLGLPVFARGDNITLPTISRSLNGTQATGRATGPGSESGAEAHGGFLKSWERHTAPSNHRTRTTPVQQRPGATAGFSGAATSEYRKATKEPDREGNRSGRVERWGSLRGLIVAIESRRTKARGSL
jgi:hypothetical protein